MIDFGGLATKLKKISSHDDASVPQDLVQIASLALGRDIAKGIVQSDVSRVARSC